MSESPKTARPAPTTTLVGATLGGYRLDGILGQGASSIVYAARDRDGAPVAVKVVRAGVAQGFAGRIERELKVLLRIKHPNVVQLKNAGIDDGRAFFVFERAESSLFERLASEGRIPASEAHALARDLLAGLSAIHAQGIVHRDLKPGNVLRSIAPSAADGRWMITDFGLARRDDAEETIAVTRPGTLLGTPHYIAPEQCQGIKADAQSDLYSAGITLWQAFVGVPPFDGALGELLSAHLDQPPPELSARAPDVPKNVARLVHRLLAKSPSARPHGALAALAELGELPSEAPTRFGLPSEPDAATWNVRAPSKASASLTSPDARLGRSEVTLSRVAPATSSVATIRRDAEERFRNDGILGQGGMGTVLRVFDTNLERSVAMKVASGEEAPTRQTTETFVREARITAQLEHPNVVPVHELGTDTLGNVFFVMRLVDGHTLHQRILSGGASLAHESERSSEERLQELLLVFLKVCDAVAFAHSRELIHCDLKPQNVMTGRFGEVYVVDWGLARKKTAPARRGPNGEVLCYGTPAYMAPEQARGEDGATDERTDVFGLGAILYSILTGGSAPFAADDAGESLRLARECAFPDPEASSLVPLPPPLVAIVRRAMAREPRDRFAQVTELRDEVQRSLRGGLSAPVRTFAPGTAIVTEGEAGDSAFFITRGHARAYKTTANGQRVVLRDMGPGDVFGELGAILAQPRTATVAAVTEVTAQVVEREALARGLTYHPWLERILQSLAERFRELDARANPSR